MKPFKIGEISAEAGAKAYGELKVAELPDGTWTSIPLVIVNGAESGPILAVVAGMGGVDFSAIEAARRVILNTDPKKLKGTLLIVPIANRPAFLTRSTANIFENTQTDLFSAFPGSPAGSLTSRIADCLLNEVIYKANYFIAISNLTPGACYTPFTSFYPAPTKEMKDKLLELAKAFGTRFLGDAEGPRGRDRDKYPGRSHMLANSKGILSILSFCGESGRVDEESVKVHVRGITNIMKYISMIEGQPEVPAEQIVCNSWLNDLRAKRGGFFRSHVKLAEHVSKGQTLGDVTNLLYETKEQIKSPVDGYIIRITTTPTISGGDVVFGIWYREE